MAVKNLWATFFQWFPCSGISSQALELRPEFDFLANFSSYTLPPKLPILAGLGKLTAVPERERQGIDHHEGTEKIWSCIEPYLPLKVAPELGLDCKIQDAKLSAFQIHAYVHPLGLIANLSFRLSAEPGIDGFRLARLLNNIERNGLITSRAHKFKKARTVVQLLAQVRDSIAAQMFVKPPPFRIGERPFLVLALELDPRLDIDAARAGPAVELMSAVERQTGNQQADPATLTEQFSVEVGRTSQVNVPSGWVLVSKSGMAVYIDPGTDPVRANRARLCDHRNVAKLLGLYRLYHAFVEEASQAKGDVPREAVEHAVRALDVMRVKYSRWWIRWGSERLRLEQPVKAAVERYGIGRVNPPNQNTSIPPSPKVKAVLNYKAFPTSLAWAQPALTHPLISFKLTNPTASEVGITLECELLAYGNKRPEFTRVPQGGTTTVDLQFALKNPFPIFFDARWGDFQYSAWLELPTGARTPLANTSARMALSPIDTFVFAHRDAVSRKLVDLSWMIAAWVSKEQAAGLPAVAKARQINGGEARGYAVPDVAAGVRAQVKALYEALQQTAHLTYDDSATIYHLDASDFAQRVRLPNRSLKDGAANCLDGCVLFASLLAAIGLHPIILLLPGHAIAGWKLEDSETSDVEFLETTVLATKTFDEARTEGMTRHAAVKAVADNWHYTGELADVKAFAIPIDVEKEWNRRGLVPLQWTSQEPTANTS